MRFLLKEFSLSLILAILLIVFSADKVNRADAHGVAEQALGMGEDGLTLTEIVDYLGRELHLTRIEMVQLDGVLDSARLQLLRLGTANVVNLNDDPDIYLEHQQRIIDESLRASAEFLSAEQHIRLRSEIELLFRKLRS